MRTSSFRNSTDQKAALTDVFVYELECIHGVALKINEKPWFLWFDAQGRLKIIPPLESKSKVPAVINELKVIMENDELKKFVEANEPKGSQHLPLKLRAMLTLVLDGLSETLTSFREKPRDYTLDFDAQQLKLKVDELRSRSNNSRPDGEFP